MKLDSSTAWKDSMAAISANREVISAIAGVFFLLPSLAFALFVPPPEPASGLTAEQTMKLASDFYLSAMPFFLAVSALQTVGMLAILTLCTDRARPTVGEAIKQGVIGFLPYFASSLILGLGFGLGGGLLLGIAVATKIGALIVLVVLAVLVAAVYVAIRTSLTAPVVAVERVRNPLTVLSRSWALTEGNAGRIALLVFLVFVVFVVVMVAVSAVFGIVSALVLGVGAAKTVDAVVSSFLSAGLTSLFTALLAAIHRQLAGEGEQVAATFD